MLTWLLLDIKRITAVLIIAVGGLTAALIGIPLYYVMLAIGMSSVLLAGIYALHYIIIWCSKLHDLFRKARAAYLTKKGYDVQLLAMEELWDNTYWVTMINSKTKEYAGIHKDDVETYTALGWKVARHPKDISVASNPLACSKTKES